MTETKKLVRHHAAFLDPERVASGIRYVIRASHGTHGGPTRTWRQFTAQVQLSDCTRFIAWEADYEGGPQSMICKIQAAIDALTRMVVDLCAVQAEYDTWPAESEED